MFNWGWPRELPPPQPRVTAWTCARTKKGSRVERWPKLQATLGGQVIAPARVLGIGSVGVVVLYTHQGGRPAGAVKSVADGCCEDDARGWEVLQAGAAAGWCSAASQPALGKS
jgi:hypothetical protein